ncbi:hypothetical protein H0I76_01640 [Limibaculum sp. M0105]|uniref:Uncharacterized protein n=1 Tax=Thermohalobaculum xanthum TaxID=2753746 RepID=A0A8J7M466_9RHOB|nr:hypothetical protein [Thermohalobaculum xanthum]MBK0397878.1 hypothetical protein [Thermohalobaculum xanthum]
MFLQAADRRQLDATSTPPSLPASGWRRDFPRKHGIHDSQHPRVQSDIERHDPALAVFLAPVIGAGIWGVILYMIFA